MPELGQAWVTLTLSTKGMERDIKRALTNAEKSAKVSPEVDTGKLSSKANTAGQRWRDLFSRNAKGSADVDTTRAQGKAAGAGRRFGEIFGRSAKASPDVDTSRMSAKATAAGAEFGSKFSAGAKQGLAALGVAGLASTVIDQFKQVMAVGMDYTKNMNTLQAVTRASGDEMARAGEKARQLGVDASLPATSVNDAAAAMTELAKGGLTLNQAMEASRGTLQLASAAGVSAQQAATIQADALNTFQLGADQANRVADLLANAANASSGEITDFAMGLAQAGGVAAGFKVPIEDTITSLAMFAKFGVKGSDAGTMMKTSLQAITDGGKPAQAAIKELGLELYNAEGVFVGYPQMMKQVAEAAGRMTDENFQAATATLFGSDAMRASMIAANGGAKSFDDLKAAVERQGGAAEVAAAKTKGLPGAWERVKNSLEALQLQAYDVLDGPLSKLADMVSDGLSGISNLGENSAFKSIAESVKSVAPGVKDIATSLAKAAGAVGAAAWAALTTALSGVAQVLKVLAPLLNAVGSFMKENQGLVTAFVAAWAGFKFLPGILSPVKSVLENITASARNMKTGVVNAADSWKTLVTYTQQANPALSAADARMAALKNTTASVASGGFNVLKAGVGGLVGALGGPLGVALTGATVAFGAIASKNAEATAAAQGYESAVKASAAAQVTLNDALLKSNGLLDENAKAEAAKKIAAAQGELEAGSKSQASFLDKFRNEQGSLIGGFFDGGSNKSLADVKDDTAAKAGQAKAAIDNLKLSQEALDAQITGSQQGFDALVASLQKQGEGGQLAAEKLQQVRADILAASDAGSKAGPVLAKLGDDVAQSAGRVRTAFSALPTDVPINVSAPGGQEVYDLLKQMGVEVNTNNDKNITVDAPMAPEVLQALEALGIQVTTNNDKTITVTQVGAEQASAEIDQAAKDREATIRVLTETAAAGVDVGGQLGVAPRANGAIVPGVDSFANGGMKMIEKPDQADIYAGQGAGTVFAEEETGGEAYIPLAPAKRERSTAILAEVARIFGFTLAKSGATATTTTVSGGGPVASPAGGSGFAGAITGPIVSVLERILSAVSRGGTTYSSSSPLSVKFAGSDAALLSQVPKGGRYDSSGDLEKGLADCTSGIEDLVNLMDGMSTSGRSMSTGNAAQWLASRGFLPTDSPVAGAFNVGYNSHHMEATLPGGTNVNFGSDASVASGGTAGAVGAWGDKTFTQHYYRPTDGAKSDAWSTVSNDTTTTKKSKVSASQILSAESTLTNAEASVTKAQARYDTAQAAVEKLQAEGASAEKIANAEKKRLGAQQSLTAAMQRHTAAETRLAEVKDKQAEGIATEESKTPKDGMDASSLGQSLVGGIMQSFGLDGSLFSDFTEWPNFKSAMAAVNYGGGLLKGIMGGSEDPGAGPTDATAGGFGIPGIPNIADMIKPLPNGAIEPAKRAPSTPPPPAPAPGVVVNGNIGMDPRQFTQRIDAHQNQAYRRNISAVRPG